MYANSIFLSGTQFFSMNSSISSFLKTVERKIQQFCLQNELVPAPRNIARSKSPFQILNCIFHECIRSLQQNLYSFFMLLLSELPCLASEVKALQQKASPLRAGMNRENL